MNYREQNQYVVYACPTGELNRQLELYFAQSRKLFGANKAHRYMPHCTLTGFFTDLSSSVDFYLDALEQAYREAKLSSSLDVKIEKLIVSKDWHGLELQAEGIKQAIANFARYEKSPTRQEPLRLKDWLHLSLAYGFEEQHRSGLQQLAQEAIDLQSEVGWELRFYQKEPDWIWHCLKSWSLEALSGGEKK